MCELASTDHPFFSFELPFHLLLPLALAADRRFPRERSFGPAYLLNASSIFPSPVRNSYTSAREHACNLPRFRKRVRKPDMSCQWELIRHSRGISYESCVNNEEKKMGAIKRYEWNLGRSFIEWYPVVRATFSRKMR